MNGAQFVSAMSESGKRRAVVTAGGAGQRLALRPPDPKEHLLAVAHSLPVFAGASSRRRDIHARPGSVPAATPWGARLPVLRSARLRARELRLSDAPALNAIASSPEVVRFVWPPPPDVAATRRFIAHAIAERRAGRYLCYGITEALTGRLLGLFEVRRLQPDFFRVEVGLFIAPSHWRRGFCHEGGRLILAFLFDQVGACRIECRSAVTNVRARGALEKLGFRREGRLRGAFVVGGRSLDQYLFSLTRPRGARGISLRP